MYAQNNWRISSFECTHITEMGWLKSSILCRSEGRKLAIKCPALGNNKLDWIALGSPTISVPVLEIILHLLLTWRDVSHSWLPTPPLWTGVLQPLAFFLVSKVQSTEHSVSVPTVGDLHRILTGSGSFYSSRSPGHRDSLPGNIKLSIWLRT